VAPVPAMFVPFPLFGLPWLAIAIAVLPSLLDREDEFGDGLDHSGSHLRWLSWTIRLEPLDGVPRRPEKAEPGAALTRLAKLSAGGAHLKSRSSAPELDR
jgi:hypothetical protein